MLVKLTNGNPVKYTMGDLRRDNPNTSFPRQISDEILANYGVYRVAEVQPPKLDNKAYRLAQGVEIVGGVWTQSWKAAKLSEDQAATNMRTHRDNLLASTDWIVIKSYERGENIPAEWELYRQALRDITAQAGFPYSVEWPKKPE